MLPRRREYATLSPFMGVVRAGIVTSRMRSLTYNKIYIIYYIMYAFIILNHLFLWRRNRGGSGTGSSTMRLGVTLSRMPRNPISHKAPATGTEIRSMVKQSRLS